MIVCYLSFAAGALHGDAVRALCPLTRTGALRLTARAHTVKKTVSIKSDVNRNFLLDIIHFTVLRRL